MFPMWFCAQALPEALVGCVGKLTTCFCGLKKIRTKNIFLSWRNLILKIYFSNISNFGKGLALTLSNSPFRPDSLEDSERYPDNFQVSFCPDLILSSLESLSLSKQLVLVDTVLLTKTERLKRNLKDIRTTSKFHSVRI